MLILKAYVNEREIDEIQIVNTGHRSGVPDRYLYRIRKPEGYNHVEIHHYREDGWKVLAQKTLTVLEADEDA